MSPEPEEDDIASRQGRTDCLVPGCTLDSPDRRVISHFFGRNKKETRAIPDDCWVSCCRQHYQRSRYQRDTADFADLQMNLVRQIVNNLQRLGHVLHWTITIRKRMMDLIAQEDALRAAGKAHHIGKPCQERALLPFCGENKSFDDVYGLIDAVRGFACQNGCEAMEFEIVPQFLPGFVEKRISQRRSSKVSSSAHGKGGSSSSSAAAGLLRKSTREAQPIAPSTRRSSKA